MYAAAFNHLVPADVREAVAAAPWGRPGEVIYWEDAYDYGGDPVGMTVSALREGATDVAK